MLLDLHRDLSDLLLFIFDLLNDLLSILMPVRGSFTELAHLVALNLLL